MKAFIKLGPIIAAFSIVISACSVVASKQVVGSHPVVNDAEMISHWMNSDGDVVSVSLDQEDPGRLHLTSESGEFENTLCYLRGTGDWVFFNLSWDPDDGEERGWIWWVVKILNDGEKVLLWRPNTEQFAKLVRDGKVTGTVEEQKADEKVVERPDGTKETVNVFPRLTVIIDDPEGKWVDDLVTGKLGVPIDWQDPILWSRVDAKGKVLPRNQSPKEAEQVEDGDARDAPR